MVNREFYFTVEKQSQAEFRDRGSRFIGLLFPLADTGAFKAILNEVKKNYPKASHYCFAYRIGADGSVFRSGDDGEPSGTAGRPILGQIDSKQLTNVLIVVVRYFGGSLLGVPGLINAYKTAAAMTLQDVPVVKKEVEEKFTLQFPYPLLNDVLRLLRKESARVIEQDKQLFCNMLVALPKKNAASFLGKIRELNGVQVSQGG